MPQGREFERPLLAEIRSRGHRILTDAATGGLRLGRSAEAVRAEIRS